jgi:hypothetical protein
MVTIRDLWRVEALRDDCWRLNPCDPTTVVGDDTIGDTSSSSSCYLSVRLIDIGTRYPVSEQSKLKKIQTSYVERVPLRYFFRTTKESFNSHYDWRVGVEGEAAK